MHLRAFLQHQALRDGDFKRTGSPQLNPVDVVEDMVDIDILLDELLMGQAQGAIWECKSFTLEIVAQGTGWLNAHNIPPHSTLLMPVPHFCPAHACATLLQTLCR